MNTHLLGVMFLGYGIALVGLWVQPASCRWRSLQLPVTVTVRGDLNDNRRVQAGIVSANRMDGSAAAVFLHDDDDDRLKLGQFRAKAAVDSRAEGKAECCGLGVGSVVACEFQQDFCSGREEFPVE